MKKKIEPRILITTTMKKIKLDYEILTGVWALTCGVSSVLVDFGFLDYGSLMYLVFDYLRWICLGIFGVVVLYAIWIIFLIQIVYPLAVRFVNHMKNKLKENQNEN